MTDSAIRMAATLAVLRTLSFFGLLLVVITPLVGDSLGYVVRAVVTAVGLVLFSLPIWVMLERLQASGANRS